MSIRTCILAIFIPRGLHICQDAFYIIDREKCMKDRKTVKCLLQSLCSAWSLHIL